METHSPRPQSGHRRIVYLSPRQVPVDKKATTLVRDQDVTTADILMQYFRVIRLLVGYNFIP